MFFGGDKNKYLSGYSSYLMLLLHAFGRLPKNVYFITGPRQEKTCLRAYMVRTTKALRLRIRAVSSGPSLSLTRSLDITECINGKQMPESYFVYAQEDLKLRILRMLESTFSLDAAQLKFWRDRKAISAEFVMTKYTILRITMLHGNFSAVNTSHFLKVEPKPMALRVG